MPIPIYIKATNSLLGRQFGTGWVVHLEPGEARRMVEAGHGEVAKVRDDGQVDWRAYLPPGEPSDQ